MNVREENKIIRDEFDKVSDYGMRYYNDKSKNKRRKVFKAWGVNEAIVETVLDRLNSLGVTGWEKCYSTYNKQDCIGIKKYETE